MRLSLLIILSLFFNYLASQTVFDTAFIRQSIYKHISALAHDSMKGRLSGTAENIKAGLYIARYFDSIGLQKVYNINGFGQEVFKNNKSYGFNIIGALEGKDSIKKDSIIIFSAHYDHVGFDYNGANDNATGTAAILTMAHYFTSADINNYTLLFIGFTGEEQGLVGSEFFIQNFNYLNIKDVFNLEMLGRGVESNNNPYIVSDLREKKAKAFNKVLNAKFGTKNINYFIKNPYPSYIQLEQRSDHYAFNNKNIKAITIMNSSPFDKHYHATTDEIQTIDFNNIKQTVWLIIKATEEFVK